MFPLVLHLKWESFRALLTRFYIKPSVLYHTSARWLFVQTKLRYALVVFDVAGNKGKGMVKSGCSNKQIVSVFRLYECFSLRCCTKLASHGGKLFSNGTVNTQDSNTGKKPAKNHRVMFWIVTIVNAFIHFGKGDDTDCKAFRKEIVKKYRGRTATFEIVSHIVTIDQIFHNSIGGRLL